METEVLPDHVEPQPDDEEPIIIGERVKNLLLQPADEWERIEGERSSVQYIYQNYVLVVSLVPVVSILLGITLLPDLPMTTKIGIGLKVAVSMYILQLLIVVVLAGAVNIIASRFGGKADQLQAMKCAVYASTPLWISGVLLLFSPNSILFWMGAGFVGSVHVASKGWAKLMQVPPSQSATFLGAGVVSWIVIYLLVRTFVGPLL